MFGGKAKTPPEPTVIGRGTIVEGTVRACGAVQVDGQIEGALIAEGQVSVGPTGSVLGDVVAYQLDVGGLVDGRINIRDHLHVAPGGTARGEVRYGSLQVDRGGVLTGSALHGDPEGVSDPAGIDDPTLPNDEVARPQLPATAGA
jgi:cytoskeletal protein CcmA (bactofilin family)